MRYRLRTLLILLGVLPPLLWIGWVYAAWKAEQERDWVRRLFSNYDEIQYFPPGPELKFSQETAANRPGARASNIYRPLTSGVEFALLTSSYPEPPPLASSGRDR